ncbi:glycosyltransferase [Alteromonas halophila]|uniref:Mannosyltransferase n=1 Tax=Alteromonas halophila TaxID=516698 RepID=A0A918JJ90_9ALTE|nr:glycosyltransferase [Alteromonas halophila]GGW82271.1 mannosyltransferase [Alteromonas halophila]
MNVLHIGKYFSPFKGGIENMMLALMRAQQQSGLNVSAAVHQHEASTGYAEQEVAQCRIYRIPIQMVLLFVPVALTAYFYLRRIIRHEAPDILHCHMPNVTCFWLLFMPAARKLPWVVHWHSDVMGERPHGGIKLLYPVYRLFERALLKRAQSIVVTSQNYLASSEPLQAFRNKCTVVPLGLDDKALAARMSHKNNLQLLCVGRLTYYKGHRYLIEAIQKCDNHVMLTIVGSGEENARLENQVQQHALDAQVRFLSGLSDEALEQELIDCDALVLPSIERTEAFGLVLLEAMRAGKACICTDVPGSGMSEVVVHNHTGLVVKRSDASSLTLAINQLQNNRDLCQRLGSEGRARFVERFEITQVEQQMREVYKAIL